MTDPQEAAWLEFTDGPYYHRIREIMISAGLGEGDTENAIANVWECGFMFGKSVQEAEAGE